MSDLRDLESEFARSLTHLETRTRFAEILAESAVGERIRLDRRSVTPSREPRLHGAVIRAWGGERWVEAATSALDPESITAATDAVGRGLSKSQGASDPPGESANHRQEWAELPARPMRDMGSEEILALARDALSWATSVPGIRDAQVSLGWDDQERVYLNTAGSRCYQVLCRVHSTVAPLAIENGRVEFDYLISGAEGGRDVLAYVNQESVTTTARSALSLLHARSPPAGRMPVLLDPSTTGTFAHESFGHGTEADQFVRDRSYLRPILGQVVGPEALTIVDEGSLPDGWGTIHFDDEGRLGQRTVLVDRGKFVGALHDRETASLLHAQPTGNARRSDFLSRLFVRMTNTYVEPGGWTLDELVQEAKNGILLEHCTSGIEDPLGGQMQIKVKRGRLIENGRLTDTVSSMALSGKVLEFLRDIRGVGRKSYVEMTPGSCGKGHADLLPVGSGGSYLLSTAVVGPA